MHGAWHFTKYFHTHYLIFFRTTLEACKVGILILILEVWNVKLREVKLLSQNHRARKQKSQDSNVDLLPPNTAILILKYSAIQKLIICNQTNIEAYLSKLKHHLSDNFIFVKCTLFTKLCMLRNKIFRKHRFEKLLYLSICSIQLFIS